LYNDLFIKLDEVAKRILTLGYSPKHRYFVYKIESKITESTEVSDGIKAIKEIMESFNIIIMTQSDLLNLSADASEEGTNALMSDYNRTQEKLFCT
jgi:starvation-inducible DNA-binding protein